MHKAMCFLFPGIKRNIKHYLYHPNEEHSTPVLYRDITICTVIPAVIEVQAVRQKRRKRLIKLDTVLIA